MKFAIAAGAALAIQGASAKLHSHDRLAALERRHQHLHHRHALPSPVENVHIEERQAGTCAFPTDKGLQYVQGDATGDLNAGWAMSGDHPCSVGTWCQYSCPPGQLMTSWNPAIPNYPSAEGGVFCGPTGIVYPSGPLCKEGATNIQGVDATGQGVSFCQTVAPGNEAQLIATWVSPNSQVTLAIPQPDYFSQISAHYYINPPGVSTEDGCVWGTSAKPVGNWAPLVGGGHQTADGRTWIDLGLNPKYKDNFDGTPINFKVEIICDGECNNPCAYDPSKHGFLEMVGSEGSAWTIGDDGAPFCTTCITSGSAYYKVSMLDGSDVPSGSGSGSGSSPAGPSSKAAASTSSAPKTTSKAAATSSTAAASSASANALLEGSNSGSSINATDSLSTPTASGAQPTWSAHILLQGNSTTTSLGASATGATTAALAPSAGASGSTNSSSPSSTSAAALGFAIPSLTGLAFTFVLALFL